MSTSAATHLSGLLARLDREVSEAATGPLQRLVGASAGSPNLVVALVGPTGTGKSALFNVLAGADIAVVGALRPTTKDAEVWPIGSRGLILIDTPPFELDPEGVGHALDRTDLAIVVITPDRYADAIVRDLANELDRRGVPNVVALNRVPDNPALAAAITVDVIASIEGDLTIVPESRTDTVDGSMLRDRIAGFGRSEIVARRDLGAAVFIEDQVEIIAQRIKDQDRLIDQVVDTAERSFADDRIDRARLAAAARLSWPLASKTLLDTVATSTTQAMEAVVKDPALHPGLVAVVRESAAAAGPLDAAPLDAWKDEVTEAAMSHMRQPALHPWQRRAVEQQAWRLAADLAMIPDRRIRAALGDRVADLRMAGNQALTVALRDAAETRIEQFMEGLGNPSPVSAEQLREAAAALLAETEERVSSVLSRADTDG
jgi:energy-coupling factor transporter ATP-binding protein EcfA2